MKMRVWELAKEVGLKSKELLELARNNGIKVTSVLNALTDNEVKELHKFATTHNQQCRSTHRSVETYEELPKEETQTLKPKTEPEKAEKQEQAIALPQQPTPPAKIEKQELPPQIERPAPIPKAQSPEPVLPGKSESQEPPVPQAEAESLGPSLSPQIGQQRQRTPLEKSEKDERSVQRAQPELVSHSPQPVNTGQTAPSAPSPKDKTPIAEYSTPPKRERPKFERPERQTSPPPERQTSPPPERQTSPQHERQTSPQHERQTSPQHERQTSPQHERQTSPQHERQTSPQHERQTSPQHERQTSPQPERQTSPQHERQTSPQPERQTSPQHERQTSPQPERQTSPQHERQTSPQHERQTSPQHERQTSPQHERQTSPRHERQTSPQHERQTSPRHERQTSPRHERQTSPQRERQTSPRHERPTSPRHERPTSPRHERQTLPQRERQTSPQHERQTSSRHERQTSPRHERQTSPQSERQISSRHERRDRPPKTDHSQHGQLSSRNELRNRSLPPRDEKHEQRPGPKFEHSRRESPKLDKPKDSFHSRHQQGRKKQDNRDRQFPKSNRFRNQSTDKNLSTKELQKKEKQYFHRPKPSVPVRKIEISIPITVKDLSRMMGVRANVIQEKLIELKLKADLDQALDESAVEMLGVEFNREIKIKKGEDQEQMLLKEFETKDAPESLQPRAPVVTFMGHVDHGKTSLLDCIRKTDVASREAGGITQHIGAYKVEYNKQSIVFLDTPGHEAFTSMRARGANVTDIVVLVVAADDGVMPQTIEAINHARAAEVAIIVAINKIDKANARPEVVMQQLARHNLIPEKWHGDTVCVEVSATTGQGINELIEYILLVAEMLELKANPKRKAYGTVLEAKMTEGKGAVATLLVQNGTLKRGESILCGNHYGRIKDIADHLGRRSRQASPSTPVEIFGLSGIPEAGDKFYALADHSRAKNIAETRQKNLREKALDTGQRRRTAEEIIRKIQEGETKELRIILKADVQGTLEAISAKLQELSHQEIKLKLIHAAAGGINERDIQLADASNALVMGFNVTANKATRDIAEEKGIEIRRYSVIYQLLDEVKQIMNGMLAPKMSEEVTGMPLFVK